MDGVPIDSPFRLYEVKSATTGAVVQVFADELTPMLPEPQQRSTSNAASIRRDRP
jgi:hypothetical protein